MLGIFTYGQAISQDKNGLSIQTANNNNPGIKLGNISGNIICDGLVASDGNRIYYSSLDTTYGLCSMNLDGTDIKKLSNDYTEYINVVDGWLYYRKASSEKNPLIGGLYKMRVDGSQEQRLVAGAPFYINVVNDRIFFINDSAGDIWSIKTDGSELNRLFSGHYECMTTDGKSLYFGWYRDSIFKASFDGKQLTKILSNNIEDPFVSGDWLYYKTDYYRICRLNTESFKIDTLVEDENLGADYIVLYNGELYFGCVDGIKKYNLQSHTMQTLFNTRVIELGLAANYIYFTTDVWNENNERQTKANLMKVDSLKSLQK